MRRRKAIRAVVALIWESTERALRRTAATRNWGEPPDTILKLFTEGPQAPRTPAEVRDLWAAPFRSLEDLWDETYLREFAEVVNEEHWGKETWSSFLTPWARDFVADPPPFVARNAGWAPIHGYARELRCDGNRSAEVDEAIKRHGIEEDDRVDARGTSTGADEVRPPAQCARTRVTEADRSAANNRPAPQREETAQIALPFNTYEDLFIERRLEATAVGGCQRKFVKGGPRPLLELAVELADRGEAIARRHVRDAEGVLREAERQLIEARMTLLRYREDLAAAQCDVLTAKAALEVWEGARSSVVPVLRFSGGLVADPLSPEQRPRREGARGARARGPEVATAQRAVEVVEDDSPSEEESGVEREQSLEPSRVPNDEGKTAETSLVSKGLGNAPVQERQPGHLALPPPVEPVPEGSSSQTGGPEPGTEEKEHGDDSGAVGVVVPTSAGPRTHGERASVANPAENATPSVVIGVPGQASEAREDPERTIGGGDGLPLSGRSPGVRGTPGRKRLRNERADEPVSPPRKVGAVQATEDSSGQQMPVGPGDRVGGGKSPTVVAPESGKPGEELGEGLTSQPELVLFRELGKELLVPTDLPPPPYAAPFLSLETRRAYSVAECEAMWRHRQFLGRE